MLQLICATPRSGTCLQPHVININHSPNNIAFLPFNLHKTTLYLFFKNVHSLELASENGKNREQNRPSTN